MLGAQLATLYQAGRREEVEQACRELLAREPANSEAAHLLGALLFERGQRARALEYFERAAVQQPGNPQLQNDVGLALHAVGRPEEAMQRFRAAIALEPAFADAYCNLGAVLEHAGSDREALESLDAAIALQPQLARAHSNRGSVLHKRRELDEALRSYDRAIAINPNYAAAHARRGALLLESGQPAAALASLDRALSADPRDLFAYVNRAAALGMLGRFDEALADCQRAVMAHPTNAVAFNARASALVRLGRHEEALADYERGMALDPRYAEVHWNAGLCLLRLGRLREGFGLFEWRKRLPRPLGKRQLAGREWTGQKLLPGSTLLLYAEQGLGDTIQFCRYATLVARAGVHVLLEVPSSLRGLLTGVEGVARVVSSDEPLPHFDWWCSLLSVPSALGTTLGSIPGRTPYLRAEPSRVDLWRQRLGPKQRRLRVGLVWAGGFRPDQPELEAANRRRNIPLEQLAGLRHPQIEFYTLQKGAAAEQELADAVARRWPGPDIHDFTALIRDFADTAALVENLDLVISVDTSTAHLAGALGKPVWIVNRFDGCWRWLLARSDTPWYPTARLYRQDSSRQWDGVLTQVRTDLFELATAPD